MAGIPSGPLLLVSPHLDDAVLSCSAIVERREAVDVLTVFAGSPDPPQRGWWDEECGFSSSAESLPQRRREDDTAFAGTPHRRQFLSLFELQYVPDGRTDEEGRTISAAIQSWVSDNPGGTVALPAGAGCRQGPIMRRLRRLLRTPCHPPQHPDHLFVRDAALPALAGAPRNRVLLYEELPYLFGGGADGEAQRVASSGRWEPELIETPVDRAAKAERIGAYATQVPHLSPPEARLDDAAALPTIERYWLLRSNTSA